MRVDFKRIEIPVLSLLSFFPVITRFLNVFSVFLKKIYIFFICPITVNQFIIDGRIILVAAGKGKKHNAKHTT